MITDMRDSASSWLVKIVLTLIILSFISFYGLSSSGKGTLNQGEVANVNGESIKSVDFSFQYQNLVQNYQQQGRLPQDVPEALYNILKQQLLMSMIYQKLKASEAKHAGLVAPDEKVKEVIKKQFSNQEGTFDYKFYETYLRNQMGKTPGQYEALQRENIRADMFESFILETGLASDLQLKDSYKKNNEKVSLSILKINHKNTAGIRPKTKAATDEVLKKYYDENNEEFKTKEKRNLEIVYFDKKTFKDGDFAKDAESILKEYSEKYPDLKDLSIKDTRLKKISSGLISYEDKIPLLNAGESIEVLNSTQNLEVGKSTVLVSRDGEKVFLTRLVDLQPANLPAFESVRPQVEKSYALNGDAEAFDAWLAATWKDIESGKTSLEELAKKTGTKVTMTESFAHSGSNQVPSIGSNDEVMKEAFEVTAEKPYFSKPVKIDDEYALIKLKSKTEADWKKFDADHENLANALHQQNAQTRFLAWMTYVEKNSKIRRELSTGDAPMPMED